MPQSSLALASRVKVGYTSTNFGSIARIVGAVSRGGAMPKTNAFQFRKVCSSTVPPNSQLHRNICMLHASDARILSHSYTGYTGYTGYTTVSHRRSWVLTACSASSTGRWAGPGHGGMPRNDVGPKRFDLNDLNDLNVR